MADNEKERSTEDLTEEASPYRLEEMRRKGQVAQSRELSGLLALIAGGAAIYAMIPEMGQKLFEFMREVFQVDLSARADLGSVEKVGKLFVKSITLIGALVLPIGAASFIIGALSSFVQVGAIFSLDPIQPDFSKVNPLKGIQKFLSLRQLTEMIRFLIKATAVILVAAVIIKKEILGAGGYAAEEPGTLLHSLAGSSKSLFFSMIGVLVLFGAIDFALQRWEFSKSVRMTKQEAKEEHKEREGDPAIKARIRAVQRDMARKRMMAAVKKADVIITNPTHIAVALVYDKEKMAAPKVVAKGADLIAQKIKAIAAEAGIPCVENVPLARTLFKTVKLNHAVPRALYQAVAEVLAYVYRLRKKEFR